MCGLVGIYSYQENGMFKRDADMFHIMLLLNSIRGAHSTGVLGIDKPGQMEWFKSVGGVETFFNWKESDRLMTNLVQKYTTVLGHGRFATKGDINAETAHPFVLENTGMIHNGTYWNHDMVAKRLYPDKEFLSDSHFCAQWMEDESLTEVVKYYNGGYAFIAYNKKENKIEFARNKERPLYIYQRTDEKQWLFSSEIEVFAYLEAKFRIKGKAFHCADDSTYSIKIGDEMYEKHVIRAPYVPPAQNRWHGYESIYEDLDDGEQCGAQWNFPVTAPPITTKLEPKAKAKPHAYKIKDVIGFSLKTMAERTLKDGTLASWLVGESVMSKGVEVVGLYPGVLENVYDEATLYGVITSIISLGDPKEKMHTRMFVKEISKGLPPKSNILMLPPRPASLDNERITLADNSTVAKWRWEELVAGGCGVCKKAFKEPPNSRACTLIMPDKGVLSGGPKLACPHCTANQIFDKQKELAHVEQNNQMQ